MPNPSYIEQLRAIGPRPVWQITPPQDYRDRMAQEGAPATPPGGYAFSDHGGSTLRQPKLVLVYLGQFWGDTARLEAFAKDLMTAGYLAPLSAYGSGQGSFAGAFMRPAVSGTIADADLQSILATAIATVEGFPQPDANTLYALVLSDGVTVQQGGSASCAAFCGYHDAFTLPSGEEVYYTVQPSTTCRGCLEPGTQPFDDFTATLAHEVAEACTDAIPGQGWYNDQTGMENADEYAWQFFAYGPWTVQGYQVNGTGNSQKLIKYSPSSQPSPQPGPGPQPQSQCQPAVDTEFAQLATIIQSAATSDPRNAAWYQGGLIWLTWAKQNVDAAIAQSGANAHALPAPPGSGGLSVPDDPNTVAPLPSRGRGGRSSPARSL